MALGVGVQGREGEQGGGGGGQGGGGSSQVLQERQLGGLLPRAGGRVPGGRRGAAVQRLGDAEGVKGHAGLWWWRYRGSHLEQTDFLLSFGVSACFVVVLLILSILIIVCFICYCFCVDTRSTSNHFVEANGDPKKE